MKLFLLLKKFIILKVFFWWNDNLNLKKIFLTGKGGVVTGKLEQGSVKKGDKLVIAGQGKNKTTVVNGYIFLKFKEFLN